MKIMVLNCRKELFVCILRKFEFAEEYKYGIQMQFKNRNLEIEDFVQKNIQDCKIINLWEIKD